MDFNFKNIFALFFLIIPQFLHSEETCIQGRVVEKGTREPLAGVNLMLMPGERIAISDEKGNFSFCGIEPGQYSITALLVNYKKYEKKNIVTKKNEKIELKIYLEPEFIPLLEVVVEEKRERKKETSQQVLKKEEAENVAGTGGDIIRAVQTLPGVVIINELNGELTVRGSGPFENLIFLDRTFFPYPYHFGGFVSSVPGEIVESVEFIAGGFSARYGNAMGGVLNIDTRDGRRDRFGGSVDVSAVMSGLLLEGPAGKNGSFFLGARRSYFDLLPLPQAGDGFTIKPWFYDYQGKYTLNISNNDKLSLMAYGERDTINFSTTERNRKDPVLSGISSAFSSDIHLFGVNLNNYRGKFSSNLTLYGNVNSVDFKLGRDMWLTLTTPAIIAWEEATIKFGEYNLLRAGFQGGVVWYYVKGVFVRPPKEDEPGFAFTGNELVESSIKASTWGAEGYVEDEIALFSKRLTLTPGVRFDYFEKPLYEAFWSPRVSIGYSFNGSTKAKASWGYYYQIPQGDEFAPGFGNPELKPQKSIHYIAGVEKELPSGIYTDFQLYYKDLRNLVATSSDPSIMYENSGKGYSYGAEIFIRKKLTNRFFGWLSYSYSRSRRKDNPEEPWRNFTFDRENVITAVATYQLSGRWSIGGRWSFMSGRPYTPVIDKIYDADRDMFWPVFGDENSKRLPPTHRLDFRAEYIKPYNTWLMKLYFEAWNLYMNKNIIDITYTDDYAEVQYVYMPPIIAFIGVKAEF